MARIKKEQVANELESQEPVKLKKFSIDAREFYSNNERPFAIKILETEKPIIFRLTNFEGFLFNDINEVYLQNENGVFSNRKSLNIGMIFLPNEVIIATAQSGKIGFNTYKNDRVISFDYEII